LKQKKPIRRSRPPSRASREAIDVSAALIFDQGRLLITRRRAGSHLGGLWEFPGGKREPNETFEQCLVREIREELGMNIAVGEMFEEITHAYDEKTVRLKFFVCTWIDGEPQARGCESLEWVSKDALRKYNFPAADKQLIEKLSSEFELFAERGRIH
jgi:mutator protein MutT